MPGLDHLDERLSRLSRAQVMLVAVGGVLLVGGVDYLTGYEISLSVFYLGPVALAAWYAGRRTVVAIAALACVIWYIVDRAAGSQYSHPGIPVWNAFVRFGFLFTTAALLTRLRDSLRREQRLARIDALTGLFSRRAFEERLEHDLALAQRQHGTLTLAYLDVDDFRAVNEEHGHAGGDRVLRDIGGVLKDTIRRADTAARMGGDEFALLFPGADTRGAQQIVSKVTQELRHTLAANGWAVTCSIGVVTFVKPAISVEQAVAAADQVMYRVKRRGKSTIEFSVLESEAQP